MHHSLIKALLTFSFLSIPMTSEAAIIYEAPPGPWGNCQFETTCGALFETPNLFAAGQFVLSANTTIATAAFFAVIDGASTLYGVDWGIWGSGGALPSGLIYYKSLQGFKAVPDGVNSQGKPLELVELDAGNLKLAAGTYWFGVHAHATSIGTYLSNSITGPAAQSVDGGRSWSPFYEGNPGIAFEILSPDIPPQPPTPPVGPTRIPAPPASALLAAGLLGLYLLRRRRPV